MSHHCKCITHTECVTTLCHGAYSGMGHPYYSDEDVAKYIKLAAAQTKPTKEKQ